MLWNDAEFYKKALIVSWIQIQTLTIHQVDNLRIVVSLSPTLIHVCGFGDDLSSILKVTWPKCWLSLFTDVTWQWSTTKMLVGILALVQVTVALCLSQMSWVRHESRFDCGHWRFLVFLNSGALWSHIVSWVCPGPEPPLRMVTTVKLDGGPVRT